MIMKNKNLRGFLIAAGIVIVIASTAYVQAAGEIKRAQKPLEAPKEAAALLGEFQKSLKGADWQKALSLCTEEVKQKADGYESAEAFFEDVLPMKEICSKTEFRLRGQSGRGAFTKYMYPIDLKDPNALGTLEWELYAAQIGGKCAIDFETKPLKIWIKHKILEQKASKDQFKIDPNETKRGFEVKLIPLSKHFVIGKPMLFRIEMKNTSDKTLGYWATSRIINESLEVTDPNGKIVPYIDEGYQILIWMDFVEPQDTIVLADNYDVRSQYHIIKSGIYTFQFKEQPFTRASNVISIEVMPGQFSPLESVVESLIPILPKGWVLTRRLMSLERPEESKGGEAISVVLRGKQAGKTLDYSIIMAIVPKQAKITDNFKEILDEMELWGACTLGQVYAKAINAQELWPDYKEQIIKALKIQKENQVSDEQALSTTNKPWNVNTDLSPDVVEKRNELLAEAANKIRTGLVKLSDKYENLEEARDWQSTISKKSQTGQIDIWLFHTDTGKARTSKSSIPDRKEYSVLVVIQPPPEQITQLSLSDLYPNLGLVGQVNTSAGNQELQSELAKLVDESLQPLKQLENGQKTINEYYQKHPILLSVQLNSVDNINEYHLGQSINIEAIMKNDSNETQIYPRGFGMSSAKYNCQIELMAPEGSAWATEAMPFEELCNYKDIRIDSMQTLSIGRWNLNELKYNEGNTFRTIGENKRKSFSEISMPGRYSVRWWDGIFQGRKPLVSPPFTFEIKE